MIDGSRPTGQTVQEVSAPAVSITNAFGVYSVAVSGFAHTAAVWRGAVSKISNAITAEIFVANNGGALGIGADLVFTS